MKHPLRFLDIKKIVRSFGLISIVLASLYAQTASAVDVDFYSGNDIFFYNPDACKVKDSSSIKLQGTTAEMIWTYLISKGLTPEQAAGVMGNIKQESGYVPTRHQSTADVWTSESGRAWGLIQWDSGRRFTPIGSKHSDGGGILGKLAKTHPELEKYVDIQWDTARNKGAQIPEQDLAALMFFELDYLYEESNSRRALSRYGGGNEWEGLKKTKTIEEALVYWHDNAERSADTPQEVIQRRGAFAKEAYENFKGLTTVAPSSDQTRPVIFLDPGHGGNIAQYVDSVTGLADRETDNGQETKDMLDVANRVKAQLEKSNYTVVLSRTTNDAQVNKRDRVTAAEQIKAQLAVSLHSDTKINQVWYQRVGAHRSYNGKTTTFSNEPTATKSKGYAETMATARAAAESNPVTTDPNGTTQAESFSREGVPSKGDISLLQLWSTNIPWIYNEISRDVNGTGLSENRKNAYAKGVVEAVTKSITPSKDGTCKSGGDFSGGNLSQTTLAYAWPEYKGLTVAATDGWQKASQKAKSEGRYIGGIRYPGIDCGGFVTTLLVDSGFDPNYNYGGRLSAGAGPTTVQKAWSQANWDNLGSGSSINVADLQPGDVAHLPGHTFVFVGNVDGFKSNIASASLDERAPMAGKEKITAADTTWFRKKGTPTNTPGSVKVQ